jgi:hypothetical protein
MNEESNPVYEKIIFENEAKGFQLRLVVNTFRDVQYLHIRKYFLSFDEGYIPSKEGISFPYDIQSTYQLLDGLMDIVSHEENIDAVKKHFTDKILDLTKELN